MADLLQQTGMFFELTDRRCLDAECKKQFQGFSPSLPSMTTFGIVSILDAAPPEDVFLGHHNTLFAYQTLLPLRQ